MAKPNFLAQAEKNSIGNNATVTVPAGSDRLLLWINGNLSSGRYPTACTWGGVSVGYRWTPEIYHPTFLNVNIWVIDEAEIAANNTGGMSQTWNTSGNSAGGFWIAFEDVNQSTPIGSYDSDVTAGSTTAGQVSLTASADQILLLAMRNFLSSGSNTGALTTLTPDVGTISRRLSVTDGGAGNNQSVSGLVEDATATVTVDVAYPASSERVIGLWQINGIAASGPSVPVLSNHYSRMRS